MGYQDRMTIHKTQKEKERKEIAYIMYHRLIECTIANNKRHSNRVYLVYFIELMKVHHFNVTLTNLYFSLLFTFSQVGTL